MSTRSNGSQTVERAFAVLNCFKSGQSSLGLSDLARRVGLSTSIVHRLLQSLVHAEFLEQDERTSQYRLGPGLASLSEVFFRQRRFDLVEPELRRLSVAAGGSAGLAARDGGETVILVYTGLLGPDQVDARPRRVPLHLSAMGKVLLAFGDSDDGGGLEALAPLSTPSEYSTSDIETLRTDLAEVRRRGYAVAQRETSLEQLSLAVPIVDHEGRIYLSLGMRLVWSTAEQQRIPHVLELLKSSQPVVAEILLGTRTVPSTATPFR